MSEDIYDIDCLVIGAGVVGLAAAMSLAKAGRDVLVVEALAQLGALTSSRNSGVIHAGLYYPTNPYKHRFCVHGRRRLYPFLEKHSVTHRKCGKLVVATTAAEEEKLHGLLAQARANLVEGVQLISGAEAHTLEPAITCRAALMSPESGILDQHGYVQALAQEIESHGGAIVRASPFLGATPLADGRIEARIGGDQPSRVRCTFLLNAAGLYAQNVARTIEGLTPNHIPALHLAKGSYFTLPGRAPFQRLIYPMPGESGLGVHATLDLSGQVRFGPDVEFLEHDDPSRVDYRVDPARASSYEAIVRSYWPAMPHGALQPDYSGCRPKLGHGFVDFRIDGEEMHGIRGLVNLFGIDSPGLTSSLALGEEVAARMGTRGPQDLKSLKPCVFFDRDGTLNRDTGYTHKVEDLTWIEGAREAVAFVKKQGWLAVVVTNQAGIARGLYDEAAVQRFHAAMQAELAKYGAAFDGLYLAPHHAEAAIPALAHPDHPDRKPNPGMLLKAMRELPIDPLRTLMIGDRVMDVEAGRAAGVDAATLSGGNLLNSLHEALKLTQWARLEGAGA